MIFDEAIESLERINKTLDRCNENMGEVVKNWEEVNKVLDKRIKQEISKNELLY